MKRILSYVYPITYKKIQTEHNGIVEITWSNGLKVLDSQHANYSYGSLQRILKFGLDQIDFESVTNILLLGLGGGCVIKSIRSEFNSRAKITAVELDQVVIDIASSEFGIHESENLRIIHQDANLYVREAQELFDLIIIDLFIDLNVPDVFYSTMFWKHIARMVPVNGFVIFNASVSKNSNTALSNAINELRKSFSVQQHNRVEGTNTIIVGKRLD